MRTKKEIVLWDDLPQKMLGTPLLYILEEMKSLYYTQRRTQHFLG